MPTFCIDITVAVGPVTRSLIRLAYFCFTLTEQPAMSLVRLMTIPGLDRKLISFLTLRLPGAVKRKRVWAHSSSIIHHATCLKYLGHTDGILIFRAKNIFFNFQCTRHGALRAIFAKGRRERCPGQL